MVSRSHPSWFLLESESEKEFRAICNYLSLGQFELARTLLRINFQEESELRDIGSSLETNAAKLLHAIIESGPPDSWICSDSVPSTAHLLCMCKDFLGDLGISVNQALDRRCEFDLMLSIALLESNSGAFASVFATELRIRYSTKVLTDTKSESLILPRLLVTSASQFLVLPGVVLPFSRKRDQELHLPGDVTDYVFKLCLAARKTGIGLIEYLHEVSPLVSSQLTHIQAGLVANSVIESDWDGVWTHMRFLNEFGDAGLLVSSPLLNDLCSLLVFLSHCQESLSSLLVQRKELGHQVSKYISDCVSPTYGSFPHVSKKRRSCFSLSSMLGGDKSYYPNESLRLRLYESLSSRKSSDSCLLEVVAQLEDAFLSLHCEKRTLPPCFDLDHPAPFWDAYSDFVRMKNVDALRYPLEMAVKLVRKREFHLAEILLVNFNQLRPALILLCWDDFGVDIDSRSSLLRVAWLTYLDKKHSLDRRCMQEVEDAVWGIARRFDAALALAKHYRAVPRISDAWSPMSGDSESVIDIMRQLPKHSILYVMRAVLVSLQSDSVVPWLIALPAAGPEAIEAKYDLDIVRAYFVLRGVMKLVKQSAGSVEQPGIYSEINSLCDSIERESIKYDLLDKIIEICFASSKFFVQKRNQQGENMHVVNIGVVFSLVCLVCFHSPPGVNSSRHLLVKVLVCLKESARYLFSQSHPPRRLETVTDWARLVHADSDLARKFLSVDGSIPSVVFSIAEAKRFVTPPRCSMALLPDAFVPRLEEGPLEVVKAALAMNDYCLASQLMGFFNPGVNQDESCAIIAEAEKFQKLRDFLRSGVPVVQDSSFPYSDPLLLIDLAISGSAPSEVSLAMLKAAQAAAETPSDFLAVWAGKLAVLLEAKTEFRSNVILSGSLDLSEVVLGIETLPNEPELLKDHLTRMHSQRSAIMALVDRVDQVRRGQVNEEPDFLSDAIRKLTREGLEGFSAESKSSGGGFLIRFLEYLSKACSLVQEAAPSAVSLFDVLSEEPVDLVARIVFEHKGFAQAQSLCELMHIDLISIVQSQSVAVVRKNAPGEISLKPYFISLQLVSELSQRNGLKSILICIERRSEFWPSSDLLEYAAIQAEALNLNAIKNWIKERQNCWIKFLFALKQLHGVDASLGFSMEEESLLPSDAKEALLAVAIGSQESMDALAKLCARAFMHAGDYIAALSELDSHLSHKDSHLINEALVGCLTKCHDSLSPEDIYELLWRVHDSDSLLRMSLEFYRSWRSDIAIKVLELCSERLSSDDASDQLEHVLHLVRVIRTMAAVAEAIGGDAQSWQSLEKLSSSAECVSVISSLIRESEHSQAVEFLDLKSAFVDPDQLDLQADIIELSRLRHIFLSLNNAKLLDRLQSCHHPVKASRLALELMDSIDSISERTRLGYLLLENAIACEEDQDRLQTQLAALALFSMTDSSVVRPQWTASGLVERPDLVFESLLMNGHTSGIEVFLNKFPVWRNDSVMIDFAAKAIGLVSSSPSSSWVSEDIGLGGIWSLSGSEVLDGKTRASHCFSNVPDMRLALQLLNLLSPNSAENALSIFNFADRLSQYIHKFFDLSESGSDNPCPFAHFSYLRQSIIALVRIIQNRFIESTPETIAVACEHAISNINLIVDLWQSSAKKRVGLAAVSDPDMQEKTRDELILQDQLDLAERVCFATGRTNRSERAADVVTVKRATLLIQAGEMSRAFAVLENKLNVKKLSKTHLGELEAAVKTRSNISWTHLQQVNEILTRVELSQKLFSGFESPQLEVPRNIPTQVRELLPSTFFDPLVIKPFTLGSHMKGEISNCQRCDEIQTDSDHVNFDVCISTPRLVEVEETNENQETDCFSDILSIFQKFGDPCSVISLLIREGHRERAILLAVKLKKVTETTFVQSVVDSGGCWGPILFELRKLPKDLVLSYFTAIELHLRASADFRNLYDCEVAMGREAAAGIVAIHLYLRTVSWEERLGWLESCVRHLDSALTYKSSKRLLQRRRRKLAQAGESLGSSSDEDEAEEERSSLIIRRRALEKIPIPFSLPLSSSSKEDVILTEATVSMIRALAELQLDVTKVLPSAPVSASLFGSIQSVSEVIDFLLMEGQVRTAKSIVNRLRLPDSALCGIFEHP